MRTKVTRRDFFKLAAVVSSTAGMGWLSRFLGQQIVNAQATQETSKIFFPIISNFLATFTPTHSPSATQSRTSTSTPTKTATSVPMTTNTRTPTSTRTPTPTPTITVLPGQPDPNRPASAQRLIFIHHSTGENWLGDGNGQLGLALRDNNYFVSDTNYTWGPSYSGGGKIGDVTDIGNWYDWFLGSSRNSYLTSLYAESGQNCVYSRLASNPGGDNTIVLFKSCFPNSAISGNPGDAPTVGTNPLWSQSADSQYHTVANIKGIYHDLLTYFSSRTDKLFIVVTAPPLIQSATNSSQAANARAVNTWLVNTWLSGYTNKNVAVFDFYNVLTSNGGSTIIHDAGKTTGNHHRYRDGAIEYITNKGSNYSQYGSGDSHPTAAGGQKASIEFLPILNIAYNRWKNG